jgi:hypothetical protein
VSIVQSIKGREGSTCQVRDFGRCLAACQRAREAACRNAKHALLLCCARFGQLLQIAPYIHTCAALDCVSIATCLGSGPALPSTWYVLQLRVLKDSGILEDLQLWRISNNMRVLLLEQIGLWVQHYPSGEIAVARWTCAPLLLADVEVIGSKLDIHTHTHFSSP